MEWISVKDRLPEPKKIVLLCLRNRRIICGELHADKRGWHVWGGVYVLGAVTHWMPLPEPSEAGE